MQTVAPDMIRIDQDSAVRRPTRSPIRPQMIPPSGRIKKEMANTAKVASSAVVGSDSGKNTLEIVAAR